MNNAKRSSGFRISDILSSDDSEKESLPSFNPLKRAFPQEENDSFNSLKRAYPQDNVYADDERFSALSGDDERDRACSSKGTHSDSSSPAPGGGKKARKARTIFSDKQLQTLEESFEKQKYLSVQDRMDLAARMGLTDTQVKTWYQNRRTKWKRQTAVGLELLQEANNLAAVRSIMVSNPYWAAYLSAHIPSVPPPFGAPVPGPPPGPMPNGLTPPGAQTVLTSMPNNNIPSENSSFSFSQIRC